MVNFLNQFTLNQIQKPNQIMTRRIQILVLLNTHLEGVILFSAIAFTILVEVYLVEVCWISHLSQVPSSVH